MWPVDHTDGVFELIVLQSFLVIRQNLRLDKHSSERCFALDKYVGFRSRKADIIVLM